jgi:pectate lyase C
MTKCASQLAIMTVLVAACASEPSGEPVDSSPATQAPAATGIAGQTGQPTMPMQQTGTPTAAAAGSGNESALAGRAAAPMGGDVSQVAGSAAPVAGAAASAGGAGAGAAGASAGAAGAGATEPEQPGTPGNCEQDPLTTLRGLAPADEDLAKDYEKYLTDELGTLSCAMAGTGNARTITQTIYVPSGATYDGRGETLTADAAAMNCDTSDGEQAESQRPYFLLAPGAQLKNVTITYPGCEGVHMMGDNVLEHITWPDAGEDAASVRSYFPGGKITIKDSEGHKAADKMFQFNAPCDVRIENFQGSDMGKLVRQNGGTEFELKIDLNNVTVTGVISAVVQSDSPLCYVRHHELSYMFTGSGDKADRVFRDIPAANVSEY